MTDDQIFELHMKFTKLHVPLAVIFVFFVIVQNSNNFAIDSIFCIFPIICIIPALIAEVIAYKKFFFKNYKFLIVLRYYELCALSACFIFTEQVYLTAGIVLVYFILYLEYTLLFDYSDTYNRNLSIIVAVLPVIISVIVTTIIRDELNISLIVPLGILAVGIYIITNIRIAFLICISVTEKKLFMQNRLLYNLNETNESLILHQEKVKHTNEELAYQKVMLEDAYIKINRTNTEIMIQNQILKYISSALEIDKLMTLITDSLLNEMHLEVCAISLNAQVVDDKKMLFKIRTRFNEEYVEKLSDNIEKGGFQPFLESNKFYIDNHMEKNTYPFVKMNETGSILIVPLIQEEIQIGFIFVEDFKYEAFVENTEFYKGIVVQFLIALNNAKLYTKMENMAIHDSLTGIYNRGHLSELLTKYLNKAINNKTSISVALFDIDKFKKVNDTYGHLFGDVIIQKIAAMADNLAMENNGIAGRYGGEEFVVFFPNKGIDEAYVLVEQLHREIREKEIYHKGQLVHISVSIGVSAYPETCKDSIELLNRADLAMYYSKENGRNTITIDSDKLRLG